MFSLLINGRGGGDGGSVDDDERLDNGTTLVGEPGGVFGPGAIILFKEDNCSFNKRLF